MKCNEIGKSKATTANSNNHCLKNLDNLDEALHDLGMLSAITETRRNRRYVSNLTLRYCMKRRTEKQQRLYHPYVMPLRHRTKSENSDAMSSEGKESNNETNSIFEPSTSSGQCSFASNCLEVPKSPAKRCQSLEYLNLSVEPAPTEEISPDMDCVSTRIQMLHVNE